MSVNPVAVNSDRISGFVRERLRLAIFLFDEFNLLVSSDGNCDEYLEQGTELSEHTNALEIFPFLVGLDLKQPKELRYVEFQNEVVADIYLSPQESGYEIVLLDSGVQRDRHQVVQQIANNVSLERDTLEDVNEELSEENLAKSKFISTFSHELKTPLTSILGYSELLISKEVTDSVDVHADAIHRSGIYLLNLINNVLEQGRADISQTTIVKKPTRVSEIVESINYMVKPLAAKKKLEFSVHLGCPEELVLMLGKQHLCQVLVNLVSNSIKYSEAGFITLEVSFSQDELLFVVTDMGIGIPKDELETIMKPFGRAKHTRHIEGAGIGLSLSSKLIKLMDGTLDIQSELGEGTVVTVSIPATETIIDTDVDPKPVKDAQILLAEDDEDLVPLIKYFLAEAGYDTLCATTPQELEDLLKENKPDLILMDHNFKEANGVEIAKDLLSNGFAGKIIMLTATSGEAIVTQAMAAGCSDFISKPIDRDALLKRLKEHLPCE